MDILSKGVDISVYQGNFNFAEAKKEGIAFAVIKGGGGDDGLYKDEKFESNYAKCKAAGLYTGAYWFANALSVTDAENEAEWFYKNILSDKKFELPVYIDVEIRAMLNLGKKALTDVIKAFCNKLEEYNCWVGIYSSLSYFSAYMNDDDLKRYAHWVAQWSTACTYDDKSCLGLWQFGGSSNLLCSNKVAGVICDQDYLLTDYPKLIKAAGLNGYKKPSATKKKAPLLPTDEIAKEVISGKWGNGDERRQKLTEAGYNYNEVQNEVNSILAKAADSGKKTLLSIDKIAKEVIAGKWGNGDERKQKLTAAGYNYDEVQNEVNKMLK